MAEEYEFFSELCKMEFLVAKAKIDELILFDKSLKMNKELEELKGKYGEKAEQKIDFVRLKQKLSEHDQNWRGSKGKLDSAQENYQKYLRKRALGTL